MTEESAQALEQELIAEEAIKLSAYQDSLGYWTIGAGHLIDARRGGQIPRYIAVVLLRHDIADKEAQLDKALPWWRELDDVRGRVLVDMTFNMGIGKKFGSGLLGFQKFLNFLQIRDYENAAKELENSKEAQQVPARTARLAAMIRTGKAV